MAKMLDLTQHTYSNYETNKRLPDISILEKLKQISNVNLDWLVSGVGNPFVDLSLMDVSKEPGIRNFLYWFRKSEIVRLSTLTNFELLRLKHPEIFKDGDKPDNKDENGVDIYGIDIDGVMNDI
jgi:transcriptional regulator with XRE-family HTH domain